MARYPVTAIDLHVSGIDTEPLRTTLASEAARQGIDVAVQPANLQRRGGGVQIGDILLALDDQPVSDPGDVLAALGGDRIGQAIGLRVARGGTGGEPVGHRGRAAPCPALTSLLGAVPGWSARSARSPPGSAG